MFKSLRLWCVCMFLLFVALPAKAEQVSGPPVSPPLFIRYGCSDSELRNASDNCDLVLLTQSWYLDSSRSIEREFPDPHIFSNYGPSPIEHGGTSDRAYPATARIHLSEVAFLVGFACNNVAANVDCRVRFKYQDLWFMFQGPSYLTVLRHIGTNGYEFYYAYSEDSGTSLSDTYSIRSSEATPLAPQNSAVTFSGSVYLAAGTSQFLRTRFPEWTRIL